MILAYDINCSIGMGDFYISQYENLWFNQGKIRKNRYQDLCVSAMVMSICCYARLNSEKIAESADYLLQHHYPDGGWNCNWNHGDKHSSIHTTLSVLFTP